MDLIPNPRQLCHQSFYVELPFSSSYACMLLVSYIINCTLIGQLKSELKLIYSMYTPVTPNKRTLFWQDNSKWTELRTVKPIADGFWCVYLQREVCCVLQVFFYFYHKWKVSRGSRTNGKTLSILWCWFASRKQIAAMYMSPKTIFPTNSFKLLVSSHVNREMPAKMFACHIP